MRPSGRAPGELRKVSLEPGYAPNAEGSCLVRFGDTHVLVYLKEDHVPASHTVLLLSVADVEAEAADLKARGITLADLPYTDEDGIARDESMPPTAWFQDPAGNWVAVGQLPS